MILRRFIVFIIIAIGTQALGQYSPKFGDNYKIYSSKEGFACENVRQIVQDSSGFLWLASNTGLYQFDGNDFKAAYSTDPSIQKCLESEIFTLFIDQSNRLWIGSQKGLVVYEPLKAIFKSIIFPIKDISYVHSIAQMPNGAIWASCNYGVFNISNELKAEALFTENNTRHSLAMILPDPLHNITWLINFNSITGIDPSSLRERPSFQYSSDNSLADNFQTAATITPQGEVWIGKYNGETYRIQAHQKKIQKFDFKHIAHNPAALINQIYCDPLGKLWINIDETGIMSFDQKTGQFKSEITTNDPHAQLPSYKITCIFKDREGNLWFNMKNNGLVLYNPSMNRFGRFQLNDFSRSQIISAVLLDQNQKLWIGTDGGGLHSFNLQYPDGIWRFSEHRIIGANNDAVMCIFEDSKQQIWVGSYRNGFGKLNKGSLTIDYFKDKNAHPLKNDIRKIQEDANGKLWLVVHGKGVCCYDPVMNSFKNYEELGSPWSFDVFIDSEQTVWVATNNGISRKRKNENHFQNLGTDANPQELGNNKVTCISEDNQKNIWVGTTRGLYMYNKAKDLFVIPNLPTLLRNSEIKSITPNKKGYLYIGTNRGLFRYQPQTGTYTHFQKDDGLPTDIFTLNAVYTNTQGLMIWGTSNGFCWLKEENTTNALPLPMPIITDAKVENRSLEVGNDGLSTAIINAKAMELNYTQNQLSFNFACPSYLLGRGNINFEYRLLGLEENWHKAEKNGSAIYSSLPSGTYTFQVKAQDGYSASAIRELQITITPPFWKTWWFYLLAPILLVFIFYTYYKFKTRSIKRLNKKLEEKIVQRTAEIVDKNHKLEHSKNELEKANSDKNKLFSIIAHDLREPVATVASLSEMLTENYANQSDEMRKKSLSHIDSASKSTYWILENLLHWSKTQTGLLNFSPSWIDLNSMISEVERHLTFQLQNKQISVIKNWTGQYMVFVDVDMMTTVIRNFMSNAIKFSQEHSKIELNIHEDVEYFSLELKDQGTGMSTEQQDFIKKHSLGQPTPGTKGEKGTGIGLILCNELLQKHGFVWTLQSQPERGTSIFIQIPKPCILHYDTEVKVQDLVATEDNKPSLTTHQPLVNKTILIVDDQEGARAALKMALDKSYHILEAQNGQEALIILEQQQPDLIISDVTMPQMDGISLVKHLKSTLKISHIPILLLTSHTSEADIMQGLATGADDYLTKPFNSGILRLKIASILTNRETVKKKFRLDDKAALDVIAENSTDKILLQKLMAAVEHNLWNPDFGVEELSIEIGMHRSNLSKKVTLLLGMSPQDFLKSQRLKHAAKLILVSGKTVSEAAYDSGFTDIKNFRKSFKNYFGMLPTEYKATQTPQ